MKESEKIEAWLKAGGGKVIYDYPVWLKNSPESLKGILREVVGRNNAHFDLSGTQITDLSLLKDITYLKYFNLYLEDSQVKDLSKLQDIPRLRGLLINDVQDIRPLKNLLQLDYLWINEPLFSLEEMHELEEALPDVEIETNGNPEWQ